MDPSPYPARGVVGRHEAEFQDVLYEQIRKTPWWLISIAMHLVLAVAFWNAGFTSSSQEEDHRIFADRQIDDIEQLEPEKPEVEPIPPIPEPPDDIPDPTIVDKIVEEVQPDLPESEWHDDNPDLSPGPFEGKGPNTEIGIGPGGGGGGPSGAFQRRRIRAEGGAMTERAVDDALEWLKNHQSPEGYWDCDNFPNNNVMGASTADGPGYALNDPGVTGLALLAFLGAGQTNRSGTYAKTVARGLRYLKQVQDPEGCFGPRTGSKFIYNHACAALAMVEAYGMTGSPLFKQSAQSAIDFIEKSRNPYLAWRYGVKPQDNDTSVTGWMVMVLKSAKLCHGLDVPQGALDGSRAWIEKATEPEYGKVGYTGRGTGPARPQDIMDRFPAEKSEALTAVGVLSRIFLGEDPRRSEAIRKGVDLCVSVLPEWDEAGGAVDMYYWYYGSLALFQVGGEPWKAWNTAMKSAIVDHQRKDGDFKGSWDPVGPWGREGGRVYSTALCTLCLEVYYRYPQVIIGRNRR
jgi:hypothetical protein